MSNTSNPSSSNEPRPGQPAKFDVDIAGDTGATSAADELFAHGLLTYLNTDTPAGQNDRVRRVMAVLESGGRAASVAPRRTVRFPIRSARGWLTLAACVTVATAAVFLGLPGEQSAQAVVQQSIDAMRSANSGDRRYEIRLSRRVEDALPSLPGAIIDTRSPNLLLLRANAPDGREIIAGRDATGDWAVRLDGGIERAHPELAWPRWAKVGDESLFVDSVDRLLEELTKSYDLQKEGTATIEGKGATSYRHIVGTKKRHPSPGGDHVEVWIDPATKSVERLEMRWDPPKPRPGEQRADQPAPPNSPDSPGVPGPGPDGRADGRPEGRDGDRPMRPRPPRADGPDFRPGSGPNRPGPDGPDAMDDRGPDDRGPIGGAPEDRAPDNRGPDARGPMRRSGGPLAGPLGGPLAGPRPRPEGGPPGRADGPRGPGPGLRPMPPHLLVMQRVEVPTLENTWFSPEAHVSQQP